MTVSAWATATQVEDTTATVVDDADLAAAQSTIEIYANRSYASTGGLGARDLFWLTSATCWQAAWQSQQFGYAARQTASSVSGDGQTVQRAAQSDADLAPLAARALRNLTWKGSRTIRLERGSVPRGAGVLADQGNERFDDSHAWRSMPQ